MIVEAAGRGPALRCGGPSTYVNADGHGAHPELQPGVLDAPRVGANCSEGGEL